jgi:preprotein translocase subunit SecY
MKLFRALKEIFEIEELRERILFTLGLILIFRLGAHVVLPGVDANELAVLVGNSDQQGSPLGLLDMFSGGAFNRASIFALGIMPYITASIVIQLMGMTVPYFQKLQKEGESGRRELNNITRLLTIAVCIAQSVGYITFLKFSYGPAIATEMPDIIFSISTVIVLTSGTVFLMWLGEKITDKGIGNGISLLIMIGIIASLPTEFMNELSNKGIYNSESGPKLLPFLVEMLFLFGIFLVSIALIQAIRRIPVNYAKKVMSGESVIGGTREYIPLKVNAAGVMPIIFAQALMFVPGMVGQFVPQSMETMSGFMSAFNDFTSIPYNVTQFFLVILFTYFYTAILFNPKQMSDDLKKSNAFIPGIKPGTDTADFIDKIMSRILLPGSVFLGLITIIPGIAAEFGVQRGFSYFFGGTSLLILVGVVLDTLQQIDSYRLMRHYDSLTRTGRKRPRQSSSPVSTTTAL